MSAAAPLSTADASPVAVFRHGPVLRLVLARPDTRNSLSQAMMAALADSLAGAADELTDAILINPYDIDGVADGISKALSMPVGERRERHRSMIEILKRNDITAWRTRFVDALISARERGRESA